VTHWLPSVIDGHELPDTFTTASELLALVTGQDVEARDDGVFRIARKVTKDRVISTVDPEACHGHTSRNRRFDGYEAHLSVDPDSELIDEVIATAANTHDCEAVSDLVASLDNTHGKPEVFGDSAYADGATRDTLRAPGFPITATVPPVRNSTGLFTKDQFRIETEHTTVTCPAGQTVTINVTRDGGGRASCTVHCATCPMRQACTKSWSGRSTSVHPHEDLLAQARTDQQDPGWKGVHPGFPGDSGPWIASSLVVWSSAAEARSKSRAPVSERGSPREPCIRVPPPRNDDTVTALR